MKIEKRVLHVSGAASLLCVSSQKIYQMIASGELFAYKAGKAWKIPEESIENYLKSKVPR